MESAMLCKVQNLGNWEASGQHKPNICRSGYACIVAAHESTKNRLEKIQSKDHEDRIDGKRFNSLSHYDLAHKFILRPQAMKIPDSKGAVEIVWKTWIIAGVADDESQEQKGGHSRGTKVGKT